MESGTTTRKRVKKESSLASTLEYVKESGVGEAIARTALRRLPAPFNLIPASLVDKVVMQYGVDEGRELLLKGLRWVKKVTDEKPEDIISDKAISPETA